MSAITVPLHCVGPDAYEGELGSLAIHIRITGRNAARIGLWMPHGWGRNPCGSGTLTRYDDNAWTGTAENTVAKRRWRISGNPEGGTLIFENDGGPSPVASAA